MNLENYLLVETEKFLSLGERYGYKNKQEKTVGSEITNSNIRFNRF